MPYVPTKRCDRPEKHEPHPWKESKHFKRECPGRISDRLPSRRERRDHPRSRT